MVGVTKSWWETEVKNRYEKEWMFQVEYLVMNVLTAKNENLWKLFQLLELLEALNNTLIAVCLR